MSLLKTLGLVGRPAVDQGAPETPSFEERRADERHLVFQEAVLVLDNHERLRVAITDLSARGAGIQYSVRLDLPFRVRLEAPTLKLRCWARVAWQNDGAAGLEFKEPI